MLCIIFYTICVYFIDKNCMKKFTHTHIILFIQIITRDIPLKTFCQVFPSSYACRLWNSKKLFRMNWVECHFCTEISDFIWMNEFDQNSTWAKYVTNEKNFRLLYKTFVHSLFCFILILYLHYGSSAIILNYMYVVHVREYASHEHNFVSLVKKNNNNNRAKYYNNQWKTKFFECTRAHQKLL